jgi:hypothetical protein
MARQPQNKGVPYQAISRDRSPRRFTGRLSVRRETRDSRLIAGIQAHRPLQIIRNIEIE